MVKTLTDRFVAGIRPADRPLKISDAKTRGLVLRVRARTKVWYFRYRKDGAAEWLKLGEYPAVGLAEARTLALDHRHAIDVDGINPAIERRKPEPEPAPSVPVFTFADFVPAFVAFQKGRNKDWANDESKVNRYLLPVWGPLPLRSITRAHVHELLDTVAGKGLTFGVNRIQALISRVFTVALDRQLVDAHPAARVIKRFRETPRERSLSDDELRTLWTGLDAQSGAASDAVRLRLLLGQRGAETAGMQWSEIDLEQATWLLPRPRTKTRQPHAVALPPTALALLTRRRAAIPDDEPRVFPGLTLQSRDHAALHTIHNSAYQWKDLRRTVGTRLADLGFDETVIGRVLNHAKHTVTGKHYNQHRYVEEIRQALTAWDAELQRILKNEPKARTRVLPMRSRS
jgi:integrase